MVSDGWVAVVVEGVPPEDDEVAPDPVLEEVDDAVVMALWTLSK